jgi:hypothetical protein
MAEIDSYRGEMVWLIADAMALLTDEWIEVFMPAPRHLDLDSRTMPVRKPANAGKMNANVQP